MTFGLPIGGTWGDWARTARPALTFGTLAAALAGLVACGPDPNKDPVPFSDEDPTYFGEVSYGSGGAKGKADPYGYEAMEPYTEPFGGPAYDKRAPARKASYGRVVSMRKTVTGGGKASGWSQHTGVSNMGESGYGGTPVIEYTVQDTSGYVFTITQASGQVIPEGSQVRILYGDRLSIQPVSYQDRGSYPDKGRGGVIERTDPVGF